MTNRLITDERQPRLRTMIESWERDGLIRPEAAAQVLTGSPGRPHMQPQSASALRRLEVIGWLGAVPVAAAGLLALASHVDVGSLLLAGLLVAVASPRSIRASARPAANDLARAHAPRHRSNRPAPRSRFVIEEQS